MSFFADAYPRQIDVLTHISPFWRTYGSWPHLVNLPVCLYCCELSYTFFYEEILVYPFLSQAR